ncbi:MAG: hypothetical protein JXB49_10360 [Bacteroidales bacterium]|nr:hypothetical protein [Bacteroidales bacterium]
MLRIIPVLIFTFMFSGCAFIYHNVDPVKYNMNTPKDLGNGLIVSYQHDMQGLNNNKQYDKKERKKDASLLAIQIENYSQDTVVLTKFNFHVRNSNGNNVAILSPKEYKNRIRLHSEGYSLIGLAGIGYYHSENPYGKVESGFTYNILPLVGGGLVMWFAEMTNGILYSNVQKQYILGKTIPPGSSVKGLIAVSERKFTGLEFIYGTP